MMEGLCGGQASEVHSEASESDDEDNGVVCFCFRTKKRHNRR